MKERKSISLLIRCLLLVVCFYPGIVSGQVQLYSGSGGSTFNPFGTHVGDYLRVLEIPYTRSLLGTPYLNEEWKNADIILLQDDLFIKDIPVKIDVRNNWIEAHQDGKVYLLDDDDTYSLILKDNNDTFITRNTLNKNGPEGFYKVLYNEKSSLFCHYSANIRQSNYVPAFDAGDKDDRIIIVKTYYAYINMQLLELKKNRRKFTRQFNSNEKIKIYLKHNHINPKDEQDLIKFLKYYDSINTLGS